MASASAEVLESSFPRMLVPVAGSPICCPYLLPVCCIALVCQMVPVAALKSMILLMLAVVAVLASMVSKRLASVGMPMTVLRMVLT